MKVTIKRWQNANRFFFRAILDVSRDENDLLILYPNWLSEKMFCECLLTGVEMYSIGLDLPAVKVSPKEAEIKDLLNGGLEVSSGNPWVLKGIEEPIKNTLEKVRQEVLAHKDYGSSTPSLGWGKDTEEINIDLK